LSEKTRSAVLAAIHDVFNTEGNPGMMAMVESSDFAFADLGGDSIDGTDFCFQVEEALDIEIEMSDLEDFPTMQKFVAMLDDRLSKAA
jgi:acyl carrier protein